MDEPPFEGLFGDTPEGRLLEHFLAMPTYTFTVNELLEQVNISRPTLMEKLRKFSEFEILIEHRIDRPMIFQLNKESDVVKSLDLFNFALIDQISPGAYLFKRACRKICPPECLMELDYISDQEDFQLYPRDHSLEINAENEPWSLEIA